MVANTVPADPPPPNDPRGLDQKVQFIFTEYGHVAHQIKGNH